MLRFEAVCSFSAYLFPNDGTCVWFDSKKVFETSHFDVLTFLTFASGYFVSKLEELFRTHIVTLVSLSITVSSVVIYTVLAIGWFILDGDGVNVLKQKSKSNEMIVRFWFGKKLCN